LNYYDILDIDRKATRDDIKKAYKKAALRWHPDKNQEDKTKAEEKFKAITEAYSTLSDDNLREQYDMKLNAMACDHNTDHNTDHSTNEPLYAFANIDIFNVKKIFRDFFGTEYTGTTGSIFDVNDDDLFYESPFSPFTKIRSEKTVYYVQCTLEELYKGGRRKVIVNGEEVNIRIEAGWKRGTKITFDDGIVFVIREEQHSKFIRVGSNLLTTKHISLDSALKGFSIRITLIDGSAQIIKVPKMKTSKYIHRLSGKGMPIRKGGRVIGYGDLLIDFDISLRN
jgi:DnaJ-class molecular chaperone